MSQTTARLKSLADQLSFAIEDFATHTDAFGREYVTFVSLHKPLGDDDRLTMDSQVRSWRLTPEEALRYITGFADGANYFIQLDRMAKEREA